MGTASAVVVAAGNSRRMGGNVDKTLLPLGAHPVLVHALLAFERCPDVDEVVLVVRADRVKIAAALARATGCAKVRRVVPGGAGLFRVTGICRIVALMIGRLISPTGVNAMINMIAVNIAINTMVCVLLRDLSLE